MIFLLKVIHTHTHTHTITKSHSRFIRLLRTMPQPSFDNNSDTSRVWPSSNRIQLLLAKAKSLTDLCQQIASILRTQYILTNNVLNVANKIKNE